MQNNSIKDAVELSIKTKEELNKKYYETLRELTELADKTSENEGSSRANSLKRLKLLLKFVEISVLSNDFTNNLRDYMTDLNIKITDTKTLEEFGDILNSKIKEKEVIEEDRYYLNDFENSSVMYFAPLIDVISCLDFQDFESASIHVYITEFNEIEDISIVITTKENLTEEGFSEVFNTINSLNIPIEVDIVLKNKEGKITDRTCIENEAWHDWLKSLVNINNKVEHDSLNGEAKKKDPQIKICFESVYTKQNIEDEDLKLECKTKIRSFSFDDKKDIKEKNINSYNKLIEKLKDCYPYAKFYLDEY